VRVAVAGATGVIGRSVIPTLVEAGHEVVGLARTPEKARLLERLGAEPHRGSLFDHDRLVAMLEGTDAVCNFATRIPVGLSAIRPHAWRANDRLRTEGVRRVVAAAREARVRRVVQESVSFLYADQGDAWIGEGSPLEITSATEPASVGESHVQEYTCDSRVGVVLRFGTIIGDDPLTRLQLRAAQRGVPIGVGSPDGWAHLVHTDDLGPAVLAALHVPSGIYNVGAEPVRRDQLVAGYSAAAGSDSNDFVGPFLRWMRGARLEPLARSLRVSSAHFSAQSGWSSRRAQFDSSWFAEALPSEAAR
jgi:nucleoside-diphosphate-sugar epimerase